MAVKASNRTASPEPVERFLADAERAARTGDRPLAMDLLLLALDMAPGDASVLVRAQMVRSHIPPSPEEAKRGAATSSEAIRIPEFPELLEVEKLPAAVAAISRRPVYGVGGAPSEMRATSTGGKPGNWGWEAAAPPKKKMPAFVRPLLMGMSGIMILIALIVVLRPSLLEDVQQAYQERTDPLLRAEKEAAAENWDAALFEAQAALEGAEGGRAARASLVLGKVYIQQGEKGRAVSSLREAYGFDTGWNVAFEAGSLLEELGETKLSAEAYRAAFEKGAPQIHWEKIAAVQREAGSENSARYIESLLERSRAGEDVGAMDSAAVRLDTL